MKGKWLRIGPLVVLLGVIVAIPVSTQVLSKSTGDNAEAGNLPLLILINRMELSPEQMEKIHGLLEGLLEEREALGLRRAELEEEMIAFNGTADELDEILETFAAEAKERVEALRAHAEDVIDQLKGILTLKQGEILQEILPGLFGDGDAAAGRAGVAGAILERRVGRAGGVQLPSDRQGEDSELGVRGRLLERLQERFAGQPEILGRLQQRLGGSAESGSPLTLTQRGRLGVARVGAALGMPIERLGVAYRGLGWLERLVEVLELKLEAIG